MRERPCVGFRQRRGQGWTAGAAFRRITRGNTEVSGLVDRIGTWEPGTEAGFVVLDPDATPAMAHRTAAVRGGLAEELFALMTLGDDDDLSRPLRRAGRINE